MPRNYGIGDGLWKLLGEMIDYRTLDGHTLCLDSLTIKDGVFLANLVAFAGGPDTYKLFELSTKNQEGGREYCLRIPSPISFRQTFTVVYAREFGHEYKPPDLVAEVLEDIAQRLAIVKRRFPWRGEVT